MYRRRKCVGQDDSFNREPGMTKEPLPSFEQPPVIETVLGVQFKPLAGFSNAHLGAFWEKLSEDWPNVVDAPPLDPVYEQFGDDQVWKTSGLQLSLSKTRPARFQIRNPEKDRMVQIQNGRFHYNWVRRPTEDYPHYPRVRKEFDQHLEELRCYLDNKSLGSIDPNQWEVTYVNHIPIGTVWNQPEDWRELFPTLPMQAARTSAASLESFSGQWHFKIATDRGRLHVEIRHGRKQSEETSELLIMTLTARGPISPDGLDLDQGLDLGHDTIVRSFAELTSSNAHKKWRRSNASS